MSGIFTTELMQIRGFIVSLKKRILELSEEYRN